MRSIWMSRLGRAATVAVVAGVAIAATGVSAEARNDGYWDGWGNYHRYYGAPRWSHQYYYGYAPNYSYYAPRYYNAPAYAYSDGYYYGPSYGPSFSLTVPLR